MVIVLLIGSIYLSRAGTSARAEDHAVPGEAPPQRCCVASSASRTRSTTGESPDADNTSRCVARVIAT